MRSCEHFNKKPLKNARIIKHSPYGADKQLKLQIKIPTSLGGGGGAEGGSVTEIKPPSCILPLHLKSTARQNWGSGEFEPGYTCSKG